MTPTKKSNSDTSYETLKKMRRDWGNIKPYTRIYQDKRRKPPKHKQAEETAE